MYKPHLSSCNRLQAKAASESFSILVVDDHEAILEGTVPSLQRRYANAEVMTARNLAETQRLLSKHHSVQLLILDLSIPADANGPAHRQVGLDFLKQYLNVGAGPNLVVLSTGISPVFRFRSNVNAYEGGFALLDKREPLANMLYATELALRGSIYWPKKIESDDDNLLPEGRIELDARWLKALKLKFHQGLTDRAIAKKMAVSDRTIRNYWLRLQDSLGIPENPDKDVRIESWKVVYELGLVD